MNETKQFLLLAKKENSQKQTFSLKSWAQLPLTHMTTWIYCDNARKLGWLKQIYLFSDPEK